MFCVRYHSLRHRSNRQPLGALHKRHLSQHTTPTRASGKTIGFGIFKGEAGVYTEIVPNASKKTLQGIICGRVVLESVIHSDGWRGYDGLVDVGYEKHFGVHHGKDAFARAAHLRH